MGPTHLNPHLNYPTKSLPPVRPHVRLWWVWAQAHMVPSHGPGPLSWTKAPGSVSSALDGMARPHPKALLGGAPGWISPSCAACHAQRFSSTPRPDPQAPTAAIPEGSSGWGSQDPWERETDGGWMGAPEESRPRTAQFAKADTRGPAWSTCQWQEAPMRCFVLS